MPPASPKGFNLTPENAAKQSFMPVMRELVRAYQAFAAYDASGYRDAGLTVSQADVLFTLGNTDGLSCKQIGEQTLITKGTLTGVLDRLEAKGLVKRLQSVEDRRSTLIKLTRRGESLFAAEFPRQIGYLKERFGRLSRMELGETERVLAKLRAVFE